MEWTDSNLYTYTFQWALNAYIQMLALYNNWSDILKASLTLSFPVPAWASDNTELTSNSIILKTVSVNIV